WSFFKLSELSLAIRTDMDNIEQNLRKFSLSSREADIIPLKVDDVKLGEEECQMTSTSAHPIKLPKSPLAQIPESSTPPPPQQNTLALTSLQNPPPNITSRKLKQPAFTTIPPTHLIESINTDPILLLTNQDIDFHLAGLPNTPEDHSHNMELEIVKPTKTVPEASAKITQVITHKFCLEVEYHHNSLQEKEWIIF
ncbi:phosphatidylinositolN-acetyglucosaminlytransferase subunit P-related, partial [Striga asiatica]